MSEQVLCPHGVPMCPHCQTTLSMPMVVTSCAQPMVGYVQTINVLGQPNAAVLLNPVVNAAQPVTFLVQS